VSRSRAYLRHQNERWKKRVKKRHSLIWWVGDSPKEIGKIAAARKCGCSGCRSEDWGPEGTRAYEKERAKKEIKQQLEEE
jgi:hypothetical protein